MKIKRGPATYGIKLVDYSADKASKIKIATATVNGIKTFEKYEAPFTPPAP